MKGWRTLLVNLATAGLGVIVAWNWGDSLPPKYAWAAVMIVSMANIGLRFLTTTPLGKSS